MLVKGVPWINYISAWATPIYINTPSFNSIKLCVTMALWLQLMPVVIRNWLIYYVTCLRRQYLQCPQAGTETKCLWFTQVTLSSSWNLRDHHQTSNISHTLVGNKLVGHSDVVGVSTVRAAIISLSTEHLAKWIGQRKLQDKTRII